MHDSATRDRDVLQARQMDPEIYRQIRMEVARRDIRLADLIADMWDAYVAAGRPGKDWPMAGSRKPNGLADEALKRARRGRA